jgi:ribose 5-phosphate isomerase RpiB
MKKYLNPATGIIHAIPEDGSQDHLVVGMTLVTEEQATSNIQARLEREFEAQDYYRKRIHSYPNMGEFVDAWVKNDFAALEAYRQQCLAIKAKYPSTIEDQAKYINYDNRT